MVKLHSKNNDSFLNLIDFIEGEGTSHELKGAPFNWMDNFDHASDLGIGNILYHQMKQREMLAAVPQDVLVQCKTRLYRNQARNMRRFGRLKEVLHVFSLTQILVIALKGAVLAENVYPMLGLRPMSDVDLLVHEEDLPKAEELLESLGFHPSEQEKSKEWYRTHHHHIVPYVSKDGALIIELHHRLISLSAPIEISNQDLWERSRTANISGVACRTLAPEDLLIHLSLHMAVDVYLGKVRVLYDLRETLRHYEKEIDWNKFLDIVKAEGVSKYLYYALWLAKETVRANVPLPILKALKSNFFGLPFEDQLVKKILRKVIILNQVQKHPFYVWILETTCLDILSNQTRSEKLRKIIHRSTQRYTGFSKKHALQTGASPNWYLFVGYPVYLIRKALGFPSP